MKRWFIILLFAPFIGLAQNTLLFEVTKDGVAQKSYLFGTLHVQEERAFSFNDSVLWAIDQCHTTAFELNLNQNEMTESLSRDKLKSIIDTAFVSRLTTFVTSDFLPKLMENITPSQLSHKITSDLMPNYFDLVKSKFTANQRTSFVDMYLQDYARSRDKDIIGIETYQEQLLALLGDIKMYQFDDKELSTKIVNAIANASLNINIKDWMSGSDEMVDLYSHADLSGLCNYLADKTKNEGVANKFYKRIFNDRNDIMFERTKSNFEQGGFFMAVGAGHLCSDNGLVRQLQNEGYMVRPVNVTTPYSRTYTWEKLDTDEYSVDLPQGVTLSENTGIYANMYADEDTGKPVFTQKGTARFAIEYIHNIAQFYDEEMDEVYEQDYEEDAPVYEYEDIAIEAPIEMEDVDNAPDIDEIGDNATAYNEYEIDIIDDQEDGAYTYKKTPKDKIAELITVDQMAYMKEVGDSIGAYYKKEMGGMMLGMMSMYKVEKDTSYIGAQKDQEVVYQSGLLVGNTLKYQLPSGEGFYELTISGDPQLLKSEDLHRFFTSFRLKE